MQTVLVFRATKGTEDFHARVYQDTRCDRRRLCNFGPHLWIERRRSASNVEHRAGGPLFPRITKDVDAVKQTAVLPLHRGKHDGKTVWFIMTDASDLERSCRFPWKC